MKALVKSPGQPVLLAERPMPHLSSTLATIKIAMVGLCRTDLRVAAGDIPVDHSLVLGHECSGHIVQDPSGRFAPGMAIAVNPLLPNKDFLGLDCDGALQEYIQISPDQLVGAEGVPLRLAAYLEPVAASMAVLKARISPQQKGVIYHANRISHLTFLILVSLGFDVEWIQAPPTATVYDTYDYAIETMFVEQDIARTLQALKPGGLLVVKSRQHTPTPIVPNLLVTKELTMQAVNYFDFTAAMEWLRTHQDLLEPLLGETYPLAHWQEAFTAARAGDAKKIFIEVGQG